MTKTEAGIACYQLAIQYLVNEPFDTDEARESLAVAIQQAIEDWFESTK
jgi:hypothetical protein